jgi:hypothetical protein
MVFSHPILTKNVYRQNEHHQTIITFQYMTFLFGFVRYLAKYEFQLILSEQESENVEHSDGKEIPHPLVNPKNHRHVHKIQLNPVHIFQSVFMYLSYYRPFLFLSLPRSLFPSTFRTKRLFAHIMSFMRATHLTNLFLLDLFSQQYMIKEHAENSAICIICDVLYADNELRATFGRRSSCIAPVAGW